MGKCLKRVYLGGLAKDITQNDLEDRFSPFGQITHIDIAKDSQGRQQDPPVSHQTTYLIMSL